MGYRFFTADVFTDRIFGGNPLAVFPDAQGLTARRMQAAARELNLSESVFVLPPADPAHTRRLRIFTPAVELPFAGHPTVGCAHVLASTGDVAVDSGTTELVFEEAVGPVRVSVEASGERVSSVHLWAARLPERGPEPPPAREVAGLLSLEVGDLLEEGAAMEAISCGVPFLLVPLTSLAAVARARLVHGRWEAVLASFWAPHVYVFSYQTEAPDARLHARMFAPAMGIEEDPATGAAVSALAGYLAPRSGHRDGTIRWPVEQGLEMGRPSRLELEVDLAGGALEAIRVGGGSVMVSEGVMEIPPEEDIE